MGIEHMVVHTEDVGAGICQQAVRQTINTPTPQLVAGN